MEFNVFSNLFHVFVTSDSPEFDQNVCPTAKDKKNFYFIKCNLLHYHTNLHKPTYPWVSLGHYAVNVDEGQPQLYDVNYDVI